MSLKYRTPGVSVTEYTSASVAPLITTADTVCIVGPATGSLERTETIQLHGSSTPIDITSVTDQNGLTVAFHSNTPHALKIGYEVKIEGFDPLDYNGVYTVADVPSANVFVVENTTTTSVATYGTFHNVTSIPLIYETDPASAIMTADSIISVKAVDPKNAKNEDANYNSTTGYVIGSYTFNPADHTISRNVPVPTATLVGPLNQPTSLNPYNTIQLEGNPDDFAESGVVYIENEEIYYSSLTSGSNESQTVTIGVHDNPTGSTVVVKDSTTTSLTVTTTAGSTSATLSATTGLANNTTYQISSSTIPAANGITFTTDGSPSTSITLSSSDGVTDGTTQAATITANTVVVGTGTDFSEDMVGETGAHGILTLGSTDYNIIKRQSSSVLILDAPVSGGQTSTETYEIRKPFNLTFDSNVVDPNPATITTVLIAPKGVTAATVKSKLKDLDSIASTSNVGVSGSTGGPYTVTFQGALANTNVPALTSNSNEVTIGTTNDGKFTLENCVRGHNGTTADAHADGLDVTQGTSIPEDGYVYVNFKYTPGDYYDGLRFTNASDIERRFGGSYETVNNVVTGKVNSPLTLAANIAFENGANEIVVQPLFTLDGDNKVTPTSTQIANGVAWSDTLEALRTVEGIGFIVPVIGQSKDYGFGEGTNTILSDQGQLSILEKVQDHVHYQQTNNEQYLIAVFGEDGTNAPINGSYASQDTLRSHAEILKNRYGGQHAQNTVLVSPSKFDRGLSTGVESIKLGGQYAAVAVASAAASRSVSSSLTRRIISGFSNILETKSKSEKITDSSYGLFVLEQVGRAIQARHAITLDDTSAATQELSVVRAKHKVINSLRNTIDTQIIGRIVADNNAPMLVASAVGDTLSIMVDTGDIVDFNSIQARIVTLSPTVIEVRFSYRPAFPVNYVNIAFSIDLTGGVATLADTTNNVNSGVI